MSERSPNAPGPSSHRPCDHFLHVSRTYPDFDQQIASIYSYDQDEIWRQAHDAAEAVVADARQVIAARCIELGIPAEFAPSLGFHWRGRGRNVVKERRDELRLVAKSRIAAIEKEACTKIEMHCLQTSTEILAHGLSSAAARDFLAQMPALTQLMPPLDMHQVALMLEARKADERPRYGGLRPDARAERVSDPRAVVGDAGSG